MARPARTGQTHDQINGGFPMRVAQWMVTAIVNAVVLAYLFGRLGINAPVDGIVLGAVAWLGFSTTFAYWSVAFQDQPRAIWVINSIAFLVIQVHLSLAQHVVGLNGRLRVDPTARRSPDPPARLAVPPAR